MFSSPALLTANRANADRSTAPRTAESKSTSSTGIRVRVSLAHGAYATDDATLDPDPALCTPAYTLSSPRAATLMRHEARIDRNEPITASTPIVAGIADTPDETPERVPIPDRSISGSSPREPTGTHE